MTAPSPPSPAASRSGLRAWHGVTLGLLTFAVAAELLCRLLPVSGATRVSYHADPWILTYASHLDFRYATGWDLRHAQKHRTNGYGFVAAREFVRDPRAVALIGDSYIESASLAEPDRPSAQLERALGGRPVYALGAAGTSLLDYAERVRWADERLDVRDFVLFVERGDVLQSLCGSGNVAARCLDRTTLQPRVDIRPPPGVLKRIVRESAFAQYLFSQLKVAPGELVRHVFARPIGAAPAPTAARPPDPATERAVDAVASAFFERVGPHVRGRLVLVLDTDRRALQAGRPLPDDPVRERFAARARAAGAVVVDLASTVQTHFARSRLSLDLGPYDGHLNALGAALLAQSAARALSPP